MSEREWVIILIKEPQLEYYAIKSKEGLMHNRDIQLKDGRTVKYGTFDVLIDDLTAKEMLMFMALPTHAKDQMLSELEDD